MDPATSPMGKAIGRIGTGVHIVTLTRDGERDGMLTSWLMQAAFEPPMVAFAVKKERPILTKLSAGSTFGVNVLSKKNMDVFKNFAKPYTPGLDRFEGLKTESDSFGNPMLQDSVAFLSCTVSNIVETGDHLLLIAEVNEGCMLQSENEPMLHLRPHGFQY
jgi:flavin reductase (DIM6/NTAB) family NADH-FMN oxidoreductase RutF